MSKSYLMTFTLENFNEDKQEDLIEAVGKDWSTPDILVTPEFGGQLILEAESQLCIGETPDEFAARITKALWTANEGYCTVIVDATCLEELPSETFEYDEDDYEEWKREGKLPCDPNSSLYVEGI